MGIFTRFGASVGGGIVGGIAASLLLAYTVLGPVPQTKFESVELSSSIQIDDFCSGTFIEDPDLSDGIQETILTARHCMPNMAVESVGQKIRIEFPRYVADRKAGFSEYDFTIVSVSEVSDLAILQYDGKISEFHTTAEIYQGNVSFGDRVFAVSYPRGWTKTITEGILGYIQEVEPFAKVSESKEFRRSTTMTAGGSSGGSLYYRTTEGIDYLVGVLTGGAGEYITFWTPLEEIRSYIQGLEINGIPEVTPVDKPKKDLPSSAIVEANQGPWYYG